MSAVDTNEQSRRNGSETDISLLTLSTHKVILQVLRAKAPDYGYPRCDKRPQNSCRVVELNDDARDVTRCHGLSHNTILALPLFCSAFSLTFVHIVLSQIKPNRSDRCAGLTIF